MKNKTYMAINGGLKCPRKIKKRVLGKRMTKSRLKYLISTVTLGEWKKTMYETPDIKPYMFCPECGCTGMSGTGNMAGYPEHYEIFRCVRCKSNVAYIDNSPFIHVLQEMVIDRRENN